ncbi:CRISPR-associated helicase Cas3' [Nocardia wallacei]|uniref:CRISPR-associated helicase Cas3' n=1 Tax=Nocardia wallacei TaxID=480035 RepID=UPI002458AE7F|nr:CRISPR-associated helicase Cas3' [Nocardia wallacei]
MVSLSTLSAWAKSDSEGGSMSLFRHCADAAAVAGLVWDRWLPGSAQRVMSSWLPRGAADGRLLLRWLAGVHDIGKLTPAFACQVPALADVMHDKGLDLRSPPSNRRALPHGLAGQVAVEQFLVAQGWSRRVARTYSIVVGGHHGVPPTRAEVQVAPSQTALLGDGQWALCRVELLEFVTNAVGAQARLGDWRDVPVPVTAQVLLTAAVIVSDWIASNQDLFPLDDSRVSEVFAVGAWEALGLPSPWRPLVPEVEEVLFRDRFALAEGAVARPLQVECMRVAQAMPGPGLMVVEAPMGEGKTEAALLAAEIVAARFGFGGVFVALPTMATSNAMFDRVRAWTERLPEAAGSMVLAHGKAALNAEFMALRRKGFASVGVDCGDEGVVAHGWFVGKKGPLANVVVGTIDQVLRAGLKARHVMLRHLALANKVVVVDEVHAADSYMSTYLCRCLEWLGAYRVPVLLLSATLPPAQRVSLIEAYQRGATGEPDTIVMEPPGSYPSVCAWPSAGPVVEIGASGRSTEVEVERIDDDLAVTVERIGDLLADGGIAGVVCNTVARAQEMFTALRDCGDFAEDELLLVHSRFVASHRAVLEEGLKTRLGPPGKAVRPHRFVVVGTQVIEQSLDIDVDVLFTDLAPIDLLLQRIGRLHRHRRSDRPARVTVARCFVRGAQWSSPPVPDRGSVAVYGAARLLRAAAVLATQPGARIAIPADVPRLVADGYTDSFTAPRGWEEAVAAAEAQWRKLIARQQEKAGVYLLPTPLREEPTLLGWLSAAVPDDVDGVGGHAQVRDGEDTVEAIVVQRVGDTVRVLSEVPEYGGRTIPTDGVPDTRLGKAVAACTIRLPASLTNYGRMGAVIDALEATWYPGWQQTPWLKGELVLELDEELAAVVAGYALRYDRLLGLCIEPIRSEK